MIIKVYGGYESEYRGAEVDAAVDRAQRAAELNGNNVYTGSNEFQGEVKLGDKATVSTPAQTDDSTKVASTAFVKSQGYITINDITPEMIAEAFGFTPENIANKVTVINEDSTNTQYPSAKAVYNVTSVNANAIEAINDKIPEAASEENQLADKAFVNSSIATSTATFRGTFNSLEALEEYSGPKDDNDYAFVVTVDSAGNTLYNRYKYTGSEWLFEYTLNNSSFTSDEWAAINSGATSTNIGQIATNTNNITSLQNSKQDTIADLDDIRIGAGKGATALQPNDNISLLSNNAGYITGITSSMVTSALGFTPYDASNPSGYISSASIDSLTDTSISSLTNGEALVYNSSTGKWENKSVVTSVSWGGITGTLSNQTDLQNALNEKTTMAAVEAKGYITGITSGMITSALGYTPYDGTTNPNGYIIGISSNDVTTALGYTPTRKISVTNPMLYSVNDKCSWEITNTLSSKKVQVNIYRVSTYEEVIVGVSTSDSTITIEFISTNDIAAGVYEAVIIG